jgi:BirA family biotin operon repressor/biotin-[acetyl-CoA-carboxylase] ligase
MPLIDPALVAKHLGPLAGRFDVDALESCDSTSSELARRAAAGAPAGSVVVADRQSAGRGRRGRTWLSAGASSLTFSLLWRHAGPAGQLAGLSLAVGVAVARALEGLGAAGIRLKWPNDVLLVDADGAAAAKLAGVLVELASDRRGSQAVIGIGLNLRPPPEDLPLPAAGLDSALPRLPDRHEVLAALLGELAGVLATFAAGGFAALRPEWLRRHAWQDQAVAVAGEGGEAAAGVCRGVDDDGALLLETAAGVRRVYAGDVSLRRA